MFLAERQPRGELNSRACRRIRDADGRRGERQGRVEHQARRDPDQRSHDHFASARREVRAVRGFSVGRRAASDEASHRAPMPGASTRSAKLSPA